MRISSWHPPKVQISWPLLIFMSKDTALIPSFIQVDDTFWLAPKISRACQRGWTAMSRAQATRVSNESSAWNHLFGKAMKNHETPWNTNSSIQFYPAVLISTNRNLSTVCWKIMAIGYTPPLGSDIYIYIYYTNVIFSQGKLQLLFNH